MKISVYIYDDVNNPRCGGGGAFRELSIHKYLCAKHSIQFFTGNFKGAKPYNENNFRCRRLGLKNNYLFSRISFSIIATLHSLFTKADVIVIGYSIYSPVLTFLFKPDKTIVLFFHLTGKEVYRKYGIFGIFPSVAEKLVLKTAKNFLTLTDSMAQKIQQQRPGIFARAGYVNFDTSVLSKSTTHKNFILCFGRIDIRMKGIDLLLGAFEKVSGQFPACRLIIAGRGKETDVEWLGKRIQSSAFSEKIQTIINPSDSEKIELLHTATFVCMPSRFEGWNIVAIEAAASSKATLGTRIHGLTDAIVENETGLLVESENVGALAEKMSLLLADEQMRNKLGENGYIWSQKFTLQRVAGIQEEFYEQVAKRHRGKSGC